MKIVIKIPDQKYKWIVDNPQAYTDDLCEIIRNGTPLPNGHGRLIDADALQKYCFNKNFDKRLSDGGLATINLYLDFQPTIIEGSDAE